MSGFSCYYHQDRNAVDKCENCGAYICLECKNVFRDSLLGFKVKSFSADFKNTEISGSKLVLCPECYFELERRKFFTKPVIPSIFFIFSIVMFIGVFLTLFIFIFTIITDSNGSSMIIIAFLPIILVIFFTSFFFISRQILQMRQGYIKQTRFNQNKFHQFVDKSIKLNDAFNDPIEHYCQRCGSKIDNTEQYCTHCGSVIKLHR